MLLEEWSIWSKWETGKQLLSRPFSIGMIEPVNLCALVAGPLSVQKKFTTQLREGANQHRKDVQKGKVFFVWSFCYHQQVSHVSQNLLEHIADFAVIATGRACLSCTLESNRRHVLCTSSLTWYQTLVWIPAGLSKWWIHVRIIRWSFASPLIPMTIMVLIAKITLWDTVSFFCDLALPGWRMTLI